MAKNITHTHFTRKRPDAVIPAIVGNAHATRTPIHRLGWNTREAPITWPEAAATFMRSSLPNAAFVIDSSFLDRQETPVEVWDALLTRQIYFSRTVWDELEPWRKTPFANSYFRDKVVAAIEGGHQGVSILTGHDWDSPIQLTSDYYITLLAARKLVGHILAAEFETSKGRKPTDDELTALCQSSVRDRGIFLAKKGLVDSQKPNFLADEEMVVFAYIHAILTGRETILLTRDSDILEQFYKAGYLLNTHYRSQLIAASFRGTPENLIPDELPVPPDHDFLFTDRPRTLDLPSQFTEWVLPVEWDAVNISCLRFGGPASSMKVSQVVQHGFCKSP